MPSLMELLPMFVQSGFWQFVGLANAFHLIHIEFLGSPKPHGVPLQQYQVGMEFFLVVWRASRYIFYLAKSQFLMDRSIDVGNC